MRKSLSYLIETELDKAEVVLAARSITDKLQSIAEQLARVDANEIMPLGDAMRDIFGGESAESFETATSTAIRDLIEKVRETRNSISENIEALNSGEPVNDMATMDDDELFPDSDESEEGEEIDFGGEEGAAEEPEADDLDMEDLFKSAEEEVSPAGRARKESIESKKEPLNENEEIITGVFKKLLKENHSARDAVTMIAQKTGSNDETIAKIIIRNAR